MSMHAVRPRHDVDRSPRRGDGARRSSPSTSSPTARPDAEDARRTERTYVFAQEVAPYGRFRVRRLSLAEDAALLHDWVRRPYAAFWGLSGKSLAEVEAAYREIERTTEVYVGERGDEPVFVLECYDPQHRPAGPSYDVQPGDRGMQLLVAPPDNPERGFTWAVFRTAMDFLFSAPQVARVVVEPDIRHAKIHALNRRAGFRYAEVLRLPDKTAHLAFCTRERYRAARAHDARRGHAAEPTHEAPSEMDPAVWADVNRKLVGKALAELSHERVLLPRLVAGDERHGTFVVTSDDTRIQYRFVARVEALDHWDVDACSIARLEADASAPPPLDALAFLLAFRQQLGLTEQTLPAYLEEVASTLFAAHEKQRSDALGAHDLVHASYPEVEAAMTEGRPALIAGGRVGFDAQGHRAHAPEVSEPVHLVWLAAHVRRAEASVATHQTYEALIARELGTEQLARFRADLAGRGLDPTSYLLLPAHPWQWRHKLQLLFAADLATRDLVHLGPGADRHQPQQSMCTFHNLSAPEKHLVQTSLSVCHLGQPRGLSPDDVRVAPAICDFVHDLVQGDTTFARHGFRVLRDVVGVGYRSACFDRLSPASHPHRQLLSALFRESPVARLANGQRLLTMAALLHRDRTGTAHLPQLIAASGLSVDGWIDRYLDAYLTPILHAFYAHDLAFAPHGENVVLVIEQHAPVGALMTGVGAGVSVLDAPLRVPESLRRIYAAVPPSLRTLTIFGDVFDGVFRHVAHVLRTQADYGEARFWRRVAACVARYRASHPALRDKLARFDLFAPTFLHACPNRLQLRGDLLRGDRADPAGSLQIAGTLANPIAPYAGLVTTRSGRSALT